MDRRGDLMISISSVVHAVRRRCIIGAKEGIAKLTPMIARYRIERNNMRRLGTGPDALIRWRIWTWVIAAALLIGTSVAASAGPKHILLLNSFGRNFSPWDEYEKDFRAELDRQLGPSLDIVDVSLATARFADETEEAPFAEYLRTVFDKRKLDLVVVVGAPAAAFFQKYRRFISPATPMLLMAVEQRRVNSVELTPNDAVVSVKIDFAGVVKNILHVLPETTSIVMVAGNSPLERYWAGQAQAEIRPYANRVAFTWYNELPFDEMLKRSATLPAHSAIFFFLLSVDAAGISHEESKAVENLHAVANAPMFSYVDAYFGLGIVGGPLIPVAESSRRAAKVAIRILNGETPGDIMTEPIGYGAPRFDWRELQRWGIREVSLPPASVVEFRQPTVFEQFKWYILAAAAVVSLEAFFIIALLLSRRRIARERAERARAEEAVREFSGRLISAQEDERSRLARELHDDVTQRLAVLAIDAGRAESAAGGNGASSVGKMRENLVKLSEDVHALSYQLHPSILDDLGLIEALKGECERFSQLESIPIDVKLDGESVTPSREIGLCLFRIAQEALRNVGRHAQAKHAEVRLRRLNDALQLSIRDDGVGFDHNLHRNRPSLGLASMQQRIYLIGGKLKIESAIGHGTIVLASVPLKEHQREAAASIVG